MLRTAECGSLREKHIDSQFTLAGWVSRRRDHGGIIFVDLRDRSGIVQVVFNPALSSVAYQAADQLRSEWVVQVKGTVKQRPAGSENPAMATGDIEVVADEATILNPSLNPSLLHRRGLWRRRGFAPAIPLLGPSPPTDAAEPKAPSPSSKVHPRLP